ncbi:MAG: hypothetical protein DIU61_002715 [Bacteroidota bacterium]|jgi:hypothetical protein|nr:MAG: hypothetical protein DIU61_08365 [Bacteroidota bacterium]
MKTLSIAIRNKSLAQEAVNCWLRYALSQPVSIDLPILFFFVVQYFGLDRIAVLVTKGKEILAAVTRVIAEGLPDRSLPLLEGA